MNYRSLNIWNQKSQSSPWESRILKNPTPFTAQAGGKIVKPAQDTFWGGYGGYFSDPDGHYWEVAYFDQWQFDEQGHLVL